MRLATALKKSPIVRRRGNAAHCGSHGTGFVDGHWLLGCCGNTCTFGGPCIKPHLTLEDIQATDWEVPKAHRRVKS